MAVTKIPWATESWNPIRYLDGWMCTKVSPGCWNCYAEAMNMRFGNNYRYGDFSSKAEFQLDAKILKQPYHWRKPRRVFVQSMGDLFHENIPFEMIDSIIATAYLCPKHTWLILTKRPLRMLEYIQSRHPMDDSCRVNHLPPWYAEAQDIIDETEDEMFEQLHKAAEENDPRILPRNLWVGVSVENQEWADKRIPVLLQIPEARRFISAEPLLAPIDLNRNYDCGTFWGDKLNWVIVGPETGQGRRECKPEWIRSIIEQCDAAKVPVFVKAFPIGKRISHKPEEWPEWAKRREIVE
jgi:protein gp37